MRLSPLSHKLPFGAMRVATPASDSHDFYHSVAAEVVLRCEDARAIQDAPTADLSPVLMRAGDGTGCI